MTDAELIEHLQSLDDKLDEIRQHSFTCSDTLSRILLEIVSTQKQQPRD
jgi:translation initiation factor 2B subunit (eIF-2B alpha/beta/delta family)